MKKSPEPPRLSHVGSDGKLAMVDVAAKAPTRREAVAMARVRMSRSTLDLVERQALPKGDVLTAARIAGIFAAKQTSSLIPLTHPLAITYADVEMSVDYDSLSILIRAVVRCEGKTGVEIEALTAASIAALTIYDMCKSAEKGIVIEEVALLQKSGGESGTWRR